jgi:hypothetical protein
MTTRNLLGFIFLWVAAVGNVWASNFSYSNLEINAERYILKEPSNVSTEEKSFSGLSFKVGYQWSENFFNRFELSHASNQQDAFKLSMTTASLGLGSVWALTDQVDVFALARVSHIYYEAETTSINSESKAYLGAEVGMRSWLNDMVEFNASLVYHEDYEQEKSKLDPSVTLPIGVGFWLDPRAAIQLRYIADSDFFGASLGYEYRF